MKVFQLYPTSPKSKYGRIFFEPQEDGKVRVAYWHKVWAHNLELDLTVDVEHARCLWVEARKAGYEQKSI